MKGLLRSRPRVRTTVATLAIVTAALVAAAAITPNVDASAAVLVAAGIGALLIRAEMRDARRTAAADRHAAEQAAAAEQLQTWARGRLMSAADDRRKQLAAIANLRGEARDWDALWGATNRQLRQVLSIQDDVRKLCRKLDEGTEAAYVDGYLDGVQGRPSRFGADPLPPSD